MTSVYSILQLLAVAFNPAFISNYAVTVMAIMIAFSKYRMALQWMPIAFTLIIIGEYSNTNFADIVEARGVQDEHTLAVKYNFHEYYINHLTSYMKAGNAFDNFWIYDYADIINKFMPIVHISIVLFMSAYIIDTAPYNQWLTKSHRWDRFIENYPGSCSIYNRNYIILSYLGGGYLSVFAKHVYVIPNETLFTWSMALYVFPVFVLSYGLSITWIKLCRSHMIERYLSEGTL
jgi:hypothetical protein